MLRLSIACVAFCGMLLQTAFIRAGCIEQDHWETPWLAPKSVVFPYEGLQNDISKLLGVQAERQRIVVTFFTRPHRSLLLNSLYSMVAYGKARNYIVLTVDPVTARHCVELRLPCYNATHMLQARSDEGSLAQQDLMYGQATWSRLMHLKPKLLAHVYKEGYHVLLSDADLSYIRPLWPAYDLWMQQTGADGAFMAEGPHGINTGNFLLLNNERTTTLLEVWTQPPPTDRFLGEQDWLNSLKDKAYFLCHNASDCQQARPKADGKALFAQYISQFGEVSGTGHCVGRLPWPACAPYTLYIHGICTAGLMNKMWWATYYGVWFLKDDGLTPERQHSFLPCKHEVAWQYEEGWTPEPGTKVYPSRISRS